MASHYYSWHHGNVHYDRRGMGEPLLLVHNLYPGASLDEYERNLAALARHFTVYAIDLLGFGQSDAPRIKYEAKLYVELIFDFLREVVVPKGGRVHVVSSGLSCAYVAEVAAWRENLFGKLVFICPRSEPTGLDSPRWFAPIRRAFISSSPLGSGFHEEMASPEHARAYLQTCFFNPKHVTEAKVQRLAEVAGRPGSIYPYAALMTGYLDSSILSFLPRVERPVMLIWGQQARPTPVEHSVRLAAITHHCRLEVVQDAGAWVHEEQSAKVNGLIVKFLDEAL